MSDTQLILLDLDETLLHTDKTISNYTIDILNKCRAKGILIGFSTSRGIHDIQLFVRAVKPDIIISSGGALVSYNNEIIFSSVFSAQEIKIMADKALALSGGTAEITVDTVDKHYWNRHVDNTDKYADWGKFTYSDFSQFDEEALKLCVDTKDPATARKIAASVPDCIEIKFSDIPWYKFSKKNATKETAIRFLSDRLFIPCENMIAFGDDFSDIGMLTLCGTGVAMGNAIPEVVAAADAVTASNNDDGVALYLEQYIL